MPISKQQIEQARGYIEAHRDHFMSLAYTYHQSGNMGKFEVFDRAYNYYNTALKLMGFGELFTEDVDELRSILRSMRISSGLSLQKAADAIGISKIGLYQIENGASQNPSFITVVKLLNLYVEKTAENKHEEETG